MSLPFLHPYIGLSSGLNTRQAASGGVGGWVELGRTTLGSVADTINVSSLANKRYYMVLHDLKNSGVIGANCRMGNSTIDTGANYSNRLSTDGGADGTSGNVTNWSTGIGGTGSFPMFAIQYIANKSDKEKLIMGHGVEQNTAGAGTAPKRGENASKWANTSNPMDIYQAINFSAGDYASGSEVVVLGYDPADTHTNNFWTELASDTLASAGDTFTSSTFTAKKYLWVQGYIINSGTIRVQLRYNGDTGSNYSNRGSDNGGADSTNTSMDRNYIQEDPYANPVFFNAFIINNSANEKLGIVHTIDRGTAGAGTIGVRRETVVKWANTAAQITSISILQDQSGDMASGSIMKVWGSD